MVSEKAWQPRTKCICPKCKNKHMYEIFWSGNGMPKIFCPICNKKANNIDDTFLHIDGPKMHEMQKNKKFTKDE